MKHLAEISKKSVESVAWCLLAAYVKCERKEINLGNNYHILPYIMSTIFAQIFEGKIRMRIIYG